MSTPAYNNPVAYDARKAKPIEAYLETLWKPIFADIAKTYIHTSDVVADFGCGTLAHIALMSHVQKIYAVDANKIMLEFGLQKLSAHDRAIVTPLCESATHTSIPSNSCSIIWSVGLTEYTDIDQLFKEMTRVATPMATLLIQFPNKYNIVHMAIQLAHFLRGTASKKYRSISEMRRIAHRYGWRVEKAVTTGFYTPLPAILIPILDPMWRLFSSFGNNTFLVLQKSTER
ncbi:MAG: class I SAM-dependent methyltransferase [Candidatus Andersenbacteria bacterium]|nr:class I SAM-dependent methyltransferase [Candidatus Andersenbacteria bacterium]